MSKDYNKSYILRIIYALGLTIILHAILLLPKEAPKITSLSNNNNTKNKSHILIVSPDDLKFMENHDPRLFLKSNSPYGYISQNQESMIENKKLPVLELTKLPFEKDDIKLFGLKETNINKYSPQVFNMPNLKELPPYPKEFATVFDEKNRKVPIVISEINLPENTKITGSSILMRQKENGIARIYLLNSSGAKELDSLAISTSSSLDYKNDAKILTFHWNIPNNKRSNL